jgi:hypothetical protein
LPMRRSGPGGGRASCFRLQKARDIVVGFLF